MHNRRDVIKNAVVAAVVGSTIGGAAGLWSVRRIPPSVTPAAQKPIRIVSADTELPPEAATAVDVSLASSPVSTKGVMAAAGDDVLQRARVLAQQPDVYALIELRDKISRRAAERGEAESASTRHLLDEVDRYLADARLLRLKLDGEEYRKRHHK